MPKAFAVFRILMPLMSHADPTEAAYLSKEDAQYYYGQAAKGSTGVRGSGNNNNEQQGGNTESGQGGGPAPDPAPDPDPLGPVDPLVFVLFSLL